MSLTIEDAHRAKREACRERGVSPSSGAYYGPCVESSVLSHPHGETEPHDPLRIDHNARRETRIADKTHDARELPKPLVECGCGECVDDADPLADETAVFRDVSMARDVCPSPRPMIVKRAAEAYYVYQKASYESETRTSCLGELRQQYWYAMESERNLLEQWDGETTTVLLSLRLSPIEHVEATDGEAGVDGDGAYYGPCVESSTSSESSTPSNSQPHRRWVPPLQLDERLRDPWRTVKDRLYYQLNAFDWEYCWGVSPTEGAATPHMHVYLWVRDPDDEVTVDHVRPAVEAFAENAVGADPSKHPVEAGESDAAVVRHNPPGCDEVDDDQLLYVHRQRDHKPFQLNTRGFAYLMNQRPAWVLKRIIEDGSNRDEERLALEGAAIAWASPKDWTGSSDAISLS